MQIGSLVVSLIDWSGVKDAYPGLKYPEKDEVLTVKEILYFESPKPFLVFEEGFYGGDGFLWSPRFREVQPPMDMTEISEIFTMSK